MLQYLVILLDDTSVSYCHCNNPFKERKLISIEHLKAGIRFAMLENLMVQFVYPDYELPKEYLDVIDTIDHHNIMPSESANDAQVIVYNDFIKFLNDGMANKLQKEVSYVLRTNKDVYFSEWERLKGGKQSILGKISRLNIVFTDIETFTERDFEIYKDSLSVLAETMKEFYLSGVSPQMNILTDRMMLKKMNNCNAGVENITLAPDGKFYICPAFYYAEKATGDEKSQEEVCHKAFSVGSLDKGLDIRNQQLYQLDHAPLCRHCDAYQCKRCVWLNLKTTLEVNTPSHEQCVMAHLERNASRNLLNEIRKTASFMPEIEINEINYLDPFDVKNEW